MAVKKYEADDDEIAYMQYANEQSGDKKEISFAQSLTTAPLRAIARGVKNVGQTFGPLGTKQDLEKTNRQFEGVLNEYLPQGEQLIPKAIERGGQAGIEAYAFPGSTPSMVRRAVVGGGLAEGAKEAGAPTSVQSGIEIASQLFPDVSRAIPNRLPTQAAQRERDLAENARRLGLSEEELALTLDQRGPIKDFLGEISAKGGRLVGRFDRTRQALGRVWNNLRGSPEAQQTLNGQQSSQLINNLSNRLSHLPAEQRNRIMQDYNDFLGSQMRGEDIIDFWQNLNYYIANGERGLGILKEDLQRGLTQISPELGRDFQITNQLYGNFHRVAERMGPNIAESLIKAGENGIVMSAISTGNYPLLKKIIGPLAARQLATEMTSNPRLMNLSSRFINSFERGIPQIAKKVYEEMLIEVGKINAEAAMKMSGMDFDKLFEAIEEEDKKIFKEAENVSKSYKEKEKLKTSKLS